jgi:hypothetical protein
MDMVDLPKNIVINILEAQFATNHIGHYVLTNLIWNTLNPGARIVCVSSASPKLKDMGGLYVKIVRLLNRHQHIQNRFVVFVIMLRILMKHKSFGT